MATSPALASIIKGAADVSITYVDSSTASGNAPASGYKVWVNGAVATQDGAGNWTANIHPTLNNTAVEARAIPTTDNNGDGAGGGGTADLGNPASSQASDAGADFDWPDSQLFLSSTHLFYENSSKDTNGVMTYRYHEFLNWTEEGGGSQEDFQWTSPDPFWSSNITVWPGIELPQVAPATRTNLVTGEVTTNASSDLSDGLSSFHGAIDYTAAWPQSGSWSLQWTEDDRNVLITGGQLGATEPVLYNISGNGTAITYPSIPWMVEGEYTDIAPEQIAIGNLGHLDTNGNLMVLLPPRSVVDVTPRTDAGGGGGAGGGSASPPPPASGMETFQIDKEYHIKTSTTVSPVPGGTNIHRHTLGVGEEVNLYFNPGTATKAYWLCTTGSVYP